MASWPSRGRSTDVRGGAGGDGLKRLLLHVCCGPCSTEVIERLSADHELYLFFYNPNIFPREEYDRRLAEAERYAQGRGIPFVKGAWDHDRWLEAVKGLEKEPEGGKRCAACFLFRLQETARMAAGLGAEAFTTTLSISPHKKSSQVNEAGERAAGAARALPHSDSAPRFITADFKKKDGFLQSCRLAKEAGMRRQDYCGCEFSMGKDKGRKI